MKKTIHLACVPSRIILNILRYHSANVRALKLCPNKTHINIHSKTLLHQEQS